MSKKIKVFDKNTLKIEVANYLKRKSMYSTYDGTPSTYDYAFLCTVFHIGSGTSLMFTRDLGMHDCGWWKNPQYNRCYHLSLSFRDILTGYFLPKNEKLTEEWIELFFHQNKRFIWSESPFSIQGKKLDVWHYRVFCDENWDPIIPKKEVYSKDFTPPNWKSWSEQNREQMKGDGIDAN